MLVVDQVEPSKETVKNGHYKLRRPILLLKRKEPHPAADAFAAFALSKSGQDIVGDMFVPHRAYDK